MNINIEAVKDISNFQFMLYSILVSFRKSTCWADSTVATEITSLRSLICFLERIHHSQVIFELGKTIGDKDMNIANALEWAHHLEAVIRIKEEEQTPPIAAIRRDETEILIDSLNRLDKQMSVGNENYARSSDGRRDNYHCDN